ncbi:hypothetical protein QCA50_004600 [Cerrena zonata]|uniref:Uncharacterized protein n=1 Tax=Cerrena zonata TaxID=2478898 RepID=A0AAW0GPI2_9APHY
MFFFATFHLTLDGYRYMHAYVDLADVPGAGAKWLANVSTWHQVLKDALYGMTELIGDLVGTYRVYVIWGRNWKVTLLPSLLAIASAVSGFTLVGLYATKITSTDTMFSPTIQRWTQTFFSVSVIQTALITGLIVYRIRQVDQLGAKFRLSISSVGEVRVGSGEGKLMYVVWVLVESAGFLLIFEVMLLGTYIANNNAQYIFLNTIACIVGISFTANTIRSTMHFSCPFNSQTDTWNSGSHSNREGFHNQHARTSRIPGPSTFSQQSYSGYPMHPITINVTKCVGTHGDGGIEGTIDYDVESGGDIGEKL